MEVNFLLDTNVIIYVAKDDQHVRDFFETERVKNGEFALSIITYIELFAGVRHIWEKAIIESILSDMTIVPLGKNVASRCVDLFHQHSTKGFRSSQSADIVIAATALHLGIPLITNNPADFRQFKGLEVVVP